MCKSDPQTADLIEDSIDQLASEGPALRRPLAGRVKGSRYHNMKELRSPSSGTTEIRLLFAFDPRREAIFPVAGDTAGGSDERRLRQVERGQGQGPRG
ncbi:MAG TPA: type II toxin-antitoxin system RelE/ParE family toxin [Streptosporangiaceae bacterium]|nr:type II toxin-antitoxin system RelE/ParE family toxin [Streptosporangiaceae bacterium]